MHRDDCSQNYAQLGVDANVRTHSKPVPIRKTEKIKEMVDGFLFSCLVSCPTPSVLLGGY